MTLPTPPDEALSLPLEAKEGRLRGILRDAGRAVVAYSGGVDSSLLAAVAAQELGDEVIAALAVGPSLPARERVEAEKAAVEIGIRLEIVQTKEFEDSRYVANTGDRCYWCRNALVEALTPFARERGATLFYGAVPDDLGEDRPGMEAAAQGGMRAPLIEAGLSKNEVRTLARRLGLEAWAKPAAACLSSRVTVGLEVTPERLARIERAEEILHQAGFRVLRVRDHGELARIEVGLEELDRLLEPAVRRRIAGEIRRVGYRRVAVDLEGYRPAGALPRLETSD